MSVTLVAETGSTNADLRAQAADWREGDWLRAERQSAGRGRLGREWRSPEGNFYASTLIRIGAGDPPVTALGLMMGIAVHDAIAYVAPRAGIQLKWPNDVMVGQAKLAGMLLEREGDCVIAGVGVNVAHAPVLADRETTAIADQPKGAGVTVEALMDALVFTFDKWVTAWRICGAPAIIEAWLERAHPVGTPLIVSTGTDRPQTGRFMGLDRDGALILARDDGTETVIHSGDVGVL